MKRFYSLDEMHCLFPTMDSIVRCGDTYEMASSFRGFTCVEITPAEMSIANEGAPMVPSAGLKLYDLEVIYDLDLDPDSESDGLGSVPIIAAVSSVRFTDNRIEFFGTDELSTMSDLLLYVSWSNGNIPCCGCGSPFGKKYGARDYHRYAFSGKNDNAFGYDFWKLDSHNANTMRLVQILQDYQDELILAGAAYEREKAYFKHAVGRLIERVTEHTGYETNLELREHNFICHDVQGVNIIPYTAETVDALASRVNDIIGGKARSKSIPVAVICFNPLVDEDEDDEE